MDELRVLLVTFPGQGHINPSLQFAKLLAGMGLKVTFVTASSAISRMARAATSPPPSLTFAGFSVEGFNTGVDIDDYMVELRRRASDAVEEMITSAAAKGQPFVHVVYTILLPSVGKIARNHNISSTFLWVQPASLFGFYYHYLNGYGDAIRENGNDPSWFIDLPRLPRLHSRDLPSFVQASNTYSFAIPSVQKHLEVLAEEKNPRILFNTFDALETEALRITKSINLVAVGPLIPSAFLDGKDPSDTSFGGDLFQESEDHYIEWLNSKPNESVVYVSFGSLSVLSDQQTEEIARGLLESRRPFLWVLRRSENGEKQEDKLTRKKELEELGMIVPWCSQLKVLQHPSVGCFVSHCGWNSTFESLVSGVPVVGFPQWSDQTMNAKLVEDAWKTGIRLTENEDGIVDGDEIKRCVELVMGKGGKGEELRRNAKKWKDLAIEAAGDHGSSTANLKAFIDEIKFGAVPS
ncbi:crocetin glucosyltransferase, chloroplastic-like [Diospyros lotus]|uniref:crocetin glucosyltransferase, chloroplastic-like n=1 Tax=Diospyros lotus TaxID=55363 RepID=UPI0022532EF3|nr:crocetin glucosyltransferase, chloroplastic-like [Diospyros lotus]